MEKRQDIDPYSPGGCFIATACMGSENVSEVILLKEFRDTVLKKNVLGKAFIKTYYTVSPPIANFISDRKYFKEFTKKIIVEPAYKISRKLMNKD